MVPERPGVRSLVVSGVIVTTGAVAALLLVLSPALIVYSQILRPYMLQVCALVFALYGLERYLGSGRWRALALYAVALLAALMLHYSSLIVFVGIGFAVPASRPRARLYDSHALRQTQVRAAPPTAPSPGPTL